MSKPDGVFLFIATYPDESTAQADYDVVKTLHGIDAIGSFDAAVVTKDDKGKVHVNKDETATRKGTWGGVAVGALVGLLFPPSIIASAAIAGAAGGFAGHLWKGMSRSDVKELGDVIDDGQAALVVLGDLTVSEALEKAELRATKQIRKQVNANLDDLDQEIKSANR
ncbi:MAG: DUF1269 domain-containing protein [Microlunatus sp.]|nr:DUF1269 domain-containing protein [Microlunatus sp.]MDN5769686.1 DUF1269 domain-containing protein [Microlunatus sp.]